MTNPWEQLLAVQALDTTIRQLDHRDRQLPEREVLAELEERLAANHARTEKAEADKHELVRAQKRIEDEIAGFEARIEHENDQLYSGGSSDPGMLQDLQNEIAALKRRIAALEDDELELMEQIEPIDAQLTELASEKAELDRQAQDATTRLAEGEAEIAVERDKAQGERDALVADIDDDSVARYEQVRDRLGGTAVARLEPGGVCGACHIKLSAVERDRIQHLPPEAEIACEDCGRFLVHA
ncbi:MAG: hypothetical protein U5K30_01705 [Acidimicrobiales bacterium]|nr:hypothetical protein [Acidimicrobiales bacterium]